MALTLNNITGFETQGEEESGAVAGTPAFETTDQRSGASALEIILNEEFDLPWEANGATDAGAGYVFGVAIRFPTFPSGSPLIARVLDDSAGVILDLVFVNTSSKLRLRDAVNGILGSDSSILTVDTWHYVEVFADLNSASGAWEWFLDGVSQGSGTGADFTDGNAFGSSSSVLRLEHNLVTGTIWFDDVYILSGAASAKERLSPLVQVFGYQSGHTTNQDVGAALANGTWKEAGDTPGVVEADGTAVEVAGASSTVADTDMDDRTSFDPTTAVPRGHGPGPGLLGNTYHFDTSDAGPTDNDAAWTDDANMFDGSITTFARTTSSGTETTNELRGEGTNAPASGGTITNVWTRVYAKHTGSSQTARTNIFTDGEGELLFSIGVSLESTAKWRLWTGLSTPSGGWTWAKVQALEVVVFANTADGLDVYRIEIFVEHDQGTENSLGRFEPHPAPLGSIIGAKYIYRLKRTNGSGTSMGYRFGNHLDGATSGGDIESALSTAYQIKEEVTEDLNEVPGFGTTYHFDASDAGPTDEGTVWTDDANAFDGDTGTLAFTTTPGSSSTNRLLGEGTNAPASGGTITSVFVRIFAGRGAGTASDLGVFIREADDTVRIGTTITLETIAVWSDWEDVGVHTGGWTWAKVQAIKTDIFLSAGDDRAEVHRIEIFVSHDQGKELIKNFRIGLEAGTTDTGGREIFMADGWAMLLHVAPKVSETFANLSDGIMGDQNSFEGPFEQ